MAPKDKVLEAELGTELRKVFNSSDRDKLTVNYVRRRVEEKLGLDDGFFNEGEWKSRSKKLLHDAIAELESGVPSSQVSASPARTKSDATPKSSAKKRGSPEPHAPPQKRQKKVTAKEPGPEPGDLSGAHGAPKKAVKNKPVKQTKKKRAASSDEEEETHNDNENVDAKRSEQGSKKESKAPPQVKTQKNVPAPAAELQEADDSPLSDAKDSDELGGVEPKATNKPTVQDEESEMSEVIDEPPKRNRKNKEPAPKRVSKPKSTNKQASELSPGEVEIKTLQGQLVKCGIRKIWAFELKKYGDDSRAKIRHLKNMLTEVGMDGRFSEAKAREIKERRELEADIEAVKEMDKNWGTNSRRASRSRATKPMKGAREEEDEEESEQSGEANEVGADEDGDSDEQSKPRARGKGSAKYRAELAFLGDESESD